MVKDVKKDTESSEIAFNCSGMAPGDHCCLVDVITLSSCRRLGVPGERWLSHVALRVQLLGASALGMLWNTIEQPKAASRMIVVYFLHVDNLYMRINKTFIIIM